MTSVLNPPPDEGSSLGTSQEPRRLPPIPPIDKTDHPYANPSLLAYPNLPPPTSSEQSAIDSLTRLLGSALQITITDGRIFIGYLSMIDHDQNILLSQAEEFQPQPPHDTSEREAWRHEEISINREMYWPRSEPSRQGGWGGREVGLALINGKDVVKVEVEQWPEGGGELLD